MKQIFLFLGVLSVITFSSCKEYLTTESPSKFQDDFVYSSEEATFNSLLNVYTELSSGSFLSDRVPMNLNGVGSDIELRPDYGETGRGELINLFPSGTSSFLASEGTSQWNQGYKTINIANEIIKGIEANRPEVLTATTSSNITQMYGEAKVIRALIYFELVRNFGDIPLLLDPAKAGMEFKVPPTNRWEILDKMITDLEKVAPTMNWASELPQKAERISKGFAYGLIAKIAMLRGGYSLHPNLNDPSDWGTYKRDEENWKTYYKKAKNALIALAAGPHSLITTDTRAKTNAGLNGNFGNPYQLVFQNQMDYVVSNESLWEMALAVEYGGNWGYAFARAHAGPNTPANSTKAYGAIRLTPIYYYSFDPKDMRRDVTCVVTGTAGGGIELPYNPAGVGDGGLNGISINKWDKIRMKSNYTGLNKAGINFVYMRYADALLLLAECNAALAAAGDAAGSVADAKTYLKAVRSRAFAPEDQAVKVDAYINGLSGDKIMEAIQNERMWEFGGECQRKHDLIRWNLYNQKIGEVRKGIRAMADGVRANKSYTFPNGQIIPDYIYLKDIKAANLPTGMICGLTYGCPVGSENNELLFPGWRGIGNAPTYVPNVSLLAINGLFGTAKTDAEKTALLASGYRAYPWGAAFLGSGGNGYADYMKWWSGYVEGKPSRYLCPIPGTVIIASEGTLKNYYGYANQ